MNTRGEPVSIDAEELLTQARWVRRLARTLVRDPSIAEDLVQETWLAALESAPAEAGRLRPWLARVVRNFARQSRRGESNRARREEATARSERSPSASETAERLESQRVLVESLESLDEPYRTTVTLRYLEGFSAVQIARKQGVPAGTVRWRLKQGLDQLRARLDKRFGGERRSWALAFLPLLRRPPLAEVAAGITTGSGAAVVEGLTIMSTVTKVGIGVVVLTVSGGVWFVKSHPSSHPVVETVVQQNDAPVRPTSPEPPDLERPDSRVPAFTERPAASEPPRPAPTSEQVKPTTSEPADPRSLSEATLEEMRRKRAAIEDYLNERTEPIILQRFQDGISEHVQDDPVWRGGNTDAERAEIYGLQMNAGRGVDRTVLPRWQYPDLYAFKDEIVRLDKLIEDRARQELREKHPQ